MSPNQFRAAQGSSDELRSLSDGADESLPDVFLRKTNGFESNNLPACRQETVVGDKQPLHFKTNSNVNGSSIPIGNEWRTQEKLVKYN